MLEGFTVNLTGTITSEFGSFKVKDVGSDATRITPDGQVVVSVRGQVPFFFKGVRKFDGTTEEWLHEPNLAAGERQIERACARAESRELGCRLRAGRVTSAHGPPWWRRPVGSRASSGC